MTSSRDARLARLDDHLRGLGSEPDAYEDELFARAADGTADELSFLDRIGPGLHQLAERGTIDPWITAAEAEGLRARHGSALAMLELRIDRAETLEIPPDADVVVTRIGALDLAGVDQVDLEVLTPDGTRIKTMAGVRFDPRDGAIFACCEGDLARRTAGPPLVNRVWGRREGERRLICEFVAHVVLGT